MVKVRIDGIGWGFPLDDPDGQPIPVLTGTTDNGTVRCFVRGTPEWRVAMGLTLMALGPFLTEADDNDVIGIHEVGTDPEE